MNAAIDELKIASVFYRAIIAGRLTFLLVQNGHRYQLYDVVRLAETGDAGELTGHVCYVQVMFIIADPALGVRESYAAVSIKLKVQSSRFRPSLLPEGKKEKE